MHPAPEDLPVERIDLAKLREANCALIDTSTLGILTDGPVSWFITHTDSSRITSHDDHVRFDTTSDQIDAALDVLARLVAYDFVVVDSRLLAYATRRLLGGRPRRPLGAEFIRAVDVPLHSYAAAARNVLQSADAIGYNSETGTPASIGAVLTDPRAYEHVEKGDIDHLYGWVREIKWIADSDQSALRSLFYLELARFASLPVFLSPTKMRYLSSVNRQMIHEALRLVQARLDAAVFDNLRQTVRAAYGRDLIVSWPPLVRYIVGIAARERISLFEAALRVRSQRSAVAFRSWLGKLQRLLLASESSTSLLNAENILRELGAIAEVWGDECNSEYGIRYRKATANVSSLPGIGRILQLAGMSQVSIKDPLLTGAADHITFMAEWYSPLSKPGAG